MMTDEQKRIMREAADAYAASFETEYRIRRRERARERAKWVAVRLPAILARAARDRELNKITVNH